MLAIISSSNFWLVFLFLVILAMRIPIAISLGAAACFVMWKWNMNLPILSYIFHGAVYKFPLLAIPFFILAGVIMDKVGIAERLVRLIREIVSDIPGGLAVATVITATVWGAVSGSGPATVAALGLVIIPGMVAAGYDKPFATAIVCVSAGLSIIIPPSIPLIVYADIMSVSIGPLFAAGILPGLIVAFFIGATVFFMSKSRGYRGKPRTPGAVSEAFKDSIWGLLTPGIILGGIYGGVFTPTEAAVVAVFYGLFVGAVIYKVMTMKMLVEILGDTVQTTGVLMFVTSGAGLFAWAGNAIGLIPKMATMLIGISPEPLLVLLMINCMLFIAGMLLDPISIMYVFLPILFPVMHHFGWDPLWFGVMVAINMALGQITPPVAVNLYVGCHISKLPMESLVRPVLPQLFAAVVALAVVVLFPSISTFVPRLFGMIW